MRGRLSIPKPIARFFVIAGTAEQFAFRQLNV